MRIVLKTICGLIPTLVVALVTLSAFSARSAPEQGAPDIQNRQAGFVVSHIDFAFAPGGGGALGCPNGLTSGYGTVGEIFSSRTDTPSDREPATLENALPRVHSSTTPNLCQNPELGAPDPRWRAVVGTRVRADGIDLDGQISRADARPAPGTCAHTDFTGLNGERGVDNQLFRVLGCTRAFQSDRRFSGSDAEMLSGAWGILITLSDVDDIHNDPDIGVNLFANADPIQVSTASEALPHATYTAAPDPRFRATTRGRIVNGVLTTDPVDFRHHWIVNGMWLEQPLQGARLRLTFMPTGGLEGVMAGYTPVEALYNLVFGFRDGKDNAGALSPSRAYSSVGAAIVRNMTCEGAYQALYRYADGERDPSTGRCNSISTQYRIEATPAFVIAPNSD